jgi:hypothetical protein
MRSAISYAQCYLPPLYDFYCFVASGFYFARGKPAEKVLKIRLLPAPMENVPAFLAWACTVFTFSTLQVLGAVKHFLPKNIPLIRSTIFIHHALRRQKFTV